MTIGAIETKYAGCKFRSRLEARWAVFFDTLGIQWKYEDQGYEVDGCRYLPDFWLPDCEVWAEVKGDPNGLRDDYKRMQTVLGPKSPLPGFKDGKTSLLVLGDVPAVRHGETVLHPILTRTPNALTRTWGFFVPSKPSGHSLVLDEQQTCISVLFGKFNWIDPDGNPESKAWDTEPWLLDTPGTFSTVLRAYKAAREARFEHGAQGR